MAKKRLVVGIWKMFIEKPEEARAFALLMRRKLRGLSGVDVYIAPPFTMIPEVSAVLESSPIRVGAQAVSAYGEGQPVSPGASRGGHTGDVSAQMLKGAGAQFAIIGHS